MTSPLPQKKIWQSIFMLVSILSSINCYQGEKVEHGPKYSRTSLAKSTISMWSWGHYKYITSIGQSKYHWSTHTCHLSKIHRKTAGYHSTAKDQQPMETGPCLQAARQRFLEGRHLSMVRFAHFRIHQHFLRDLWEKCVLIFIGIKIR